ncbi:MAG: Coq4 family protein [Pseudomonadota bacterium]
MTAKANTILRDIRYLKPFKALRSVRALINNPEDTGEVFKIIEALKGASLMRAVERLRITVNGRDLLWEKPEILNLLRDREYLASLPDNSLGRAYLAFVESQALHADGLVRASEEAPRDRGKSDDERWLANRLRDIHDLQHVLCGYGRDELGELCLLSFMVSQTPNRGIAFIVYMAKRKFREEAPEIPVDICVAEGRRMGEAATWFATIKWEQQLAQPLVEVRQELGLVPPKVYLSAVTAANVSAESVKR